MKTRGKILWLAALALLLTGQTPAPSEPPPAYDVTAQTISEFIDALPRDAVSDLPIITVPVTGDYQVGVFGVFRPQQYPGVSNQHLVNTTEIYYMLTGHATLVTGGTMIDPVARSSTYLRGAGIEGGVSRRVGPGDVVIIPGHTPHWFNELESDISYLIFRPDPDNRLQQILPD